MAQEARPSSRLPRLVHVLPWALGVGGAQRMIDEWCARHATKWDAHIVAPSGPRGFSYPGATVHDDVAAADAHSFVRALQADAVVHHGPAFNYARVTPDTKALVWVIHGEYLFNSPRPGWGKPTVVLSNYRPRHLHTSWPPLTVVPLGVDAARYGVKTHEPREPLVVGVVGRISPEKTPLSFLAALRRWSAGPWRLRFVGQGLTNPWIDRVRRETRDVPFVEFRGEVAPDQMADEYHQLDAVLVPSITETGSYVVLEAMASGLPVIARAVGGVPFTTGGAAVLRTEDRDLLQAVRDFDDCVVRTAWGIRGRLVVERDHAVNSQQEQLESAFVAAHRRGVRSGQISQEHP